MPLELRTAPATPAVLLADAKTYLGIDDTVNDAEITSMLNALTERAEHWTGRALVTQTHALWLDAFPSSEKKGSPRDGLFQLPINYFDEADRNLKIPRPPLQSVTFLKTYDTANAATVFDASNYQVDTVSSPARICLVVATSWPTALRTMNAIEIEFVCGYGAESDVPAALKEGIKIWLKLLFAQKTKLFESDESTQGLAEQVGGGIPPQVEALWKPYQLIRL